MTLREALDLLELNERTLEQSMLESSLQNRLEHTELRHVLRVFEAYRKVNAFLNPSFNTQGDARMTIIDESVPGGPMLEVTRASAPLATASSANSLKERDTFSDTMIETWAAADAALNESKATLSKATLSKATLSKSTLALEGAAPRAAGVNLFAMLGLIAAAFSVGMIVLGPTMSLILKPSAISPSSPVPSISAPSTSAPSVSSLPPVVTAPPAPVVTPVAPVVASRPAVTRPAPPIAVAVKPVAPADPIKPAVSVKPPASVKPTAPAITKPAARPAVTAKPPVVRVEPRATPRPRVVTPRVTTQPRVTAQPRVVTPRVTSQPRVTTTQPRVAARRINPTPLASSRPLMTVAPSRRAVNQRQFAQWDSAGVVLRYRSWRLVPDAVRGLSADAFKAAIFVARDPASLPDIRR